MATYYNENDPKAAAWLRELVKQGLIADGVVDARAIQQVRADDLVGFDQCHFFAGIGGWSYALRLASWPDARAVWTGSCPCQPFSTAGRHGETADARHLWPEFRRLIAEGRPPVIFGEQVASAAGRNWFTGVRSDLETLAYDTGCADLCAASVGAPHIRQRLYWVADANLSSKHQWTSGRQQSICNESNRRATRMGNAAQPRQQEQWGEYSPSGERCSGLSGLAMQASVPEWNGPTVAVKCADGPRRISAQPNAFPLAHGVPTRMGKLRGAGNAIVPQLAAEFIRAYQEVIDAY